MAFDQTTRNRLNRLVADARKLLTNEFTRQLQAIYGMNPVTGDVADIKTLMGLTPSQQESAQLLRETFDHYLVSSEKGKAKECKLAALDRIVREQAFTVLNRIAALRMSEARGFLIESIANGYESKGFQLFHRIAGTSLGETGDAYRHYLFSIFDEFSLDLSVLFDRFSAQGRLFPSTPVTIELLSLINDDEVVALWAEDETIGWIYQYFNSQEERKKMRDASQAPRNSRELAVRNQFFTPRYVVEFLTDNTLGRIWYEMTQGKTQLVEECKYLVRRPNEIFLTKNEQAPELEITEGLSQEELLKQTVYIEHRELKDPREIRMLDPACGSMHFGLYCFDLFECIYEEAWDIEVAQGADSIIRDSNKIPLTEAYSDKAEFLMHVPRLIIENNIHGVDIDPRAAQVAGLSLWQRAHNSWQQAGIKPQQRPQILKSNIVCAEPMPGEKELLQEFTSQLKPNVLGQLVEVIFEKMQLAGEAGTLLKIEKEIEEAIAGAKAVWHLQNQTLSQFPDLAKVAKNRGEIDFDVSDIDDEGFWQQAEQKILDALAMYASSTSAQISGQKRLFASDVAKGFAFIDLCKKRFDVVLMNPPFGEPTKKTKSYFKNVYGDYYVEIMANFVSRGFSLLNPLGLVGVLSSRTILINSTCENLRREVSNRHGRLDLCADFGYGVLDDAMVEAASYTLKKTSLSNYPSTFLGLLNAQSKEETLLKIIHSLGKLEEKSELVYLRNLSTYESVFRFPWAYWLTSELLNQMVSSTTIEDNDYQVRVGSSTADNYRFLRLYWEVSPEMIATSREQTEEGVPWVAISKGGEYWPLFDEIHLMSNWRFDGKEMRVFPGSTLRSTKDYFKGGGTYPYRTTSTFSCRVLPSGCMFADGGPAILSDKVTDLIEVILYMNTRISRYFLEVFMGESDGSVSGGAARNYIPRAVGAIPITKLTGRNRDSLSNIFTVWLNSAMMKSKIDETSRYFDASSFLLNKSLKEFYLSQYHQKLTNAVRAIESAEQSEKLFANVMGISDISLQKIETAFGAIPSTYESRNLCTDEINQFMEALDLSMDALVDLVSEKLGNKRYISKKSFYADRQLELLCHLFHINPSSIVSAIIELNYISEKEISDLAFKSIQFIIGMCFPRWSDENISQNREEPINVFDPMPNYSPAMKISCNTNIQESIFYSDLNNECGLSAGIKKHLSRHFNMNSESMESDILQSLDVISIQKYLNNSNEFFNSHLSAYSKSRRQAPIYWPLQSKRGTYTTWIYYHNQDNQLLMTTVNDFVTPRLDEVNSEINSLNSEGNRSLKDEKRIEQLLDCKSELEDYLEELLCLSKFWQPNLNDGVQINAAPLWRLFQHKTWQKKLKQTWDKLEDGDYDWAHLAYTTWPERVLKKCHTDRSLAIAHDVENGLWHEVEVIKGRKKEPVWEWQSKSLSDSDLRAYIKNKISTDDRLKLFRANNANTNGDA